MIHTTDTRDTVVEVVAGFVEPALGKVRVKREPGASWFVLTAIEAVIRVVETIHTTDKLANATARNKTLLRGSKGKLQIL